MVLGAKVQNKAEKDAGEESAIIFMGWLGMATCKCDMCWKTWKWWGGKKDIWRKNVCAIGNGKWESLGGSKKGRLILIVWGKNKDASVARAEERD